MNELAINAYHAAITLGRRIPRAEASTLPGTEVYPVGRPATGAVMFVTADTLLDCGYALSFANAAMFCPQSKHLPGAYNLLVIGGAPSDSVAYGVHSAGVTHILRPAPSASVAKAHESALISTVKRIFANAKITVSTHSDEDEGWTRPLIEVETGISDPDQLIALEYKFYEEVENHESLKAALDTTTVLFE